MVQGSVVDRAHRVFKNLAAIAQEAGTTLDNAVKVTVYLADIADFQAVNAVYGEYFTQPFPARSAFQVAALPLGSDIEVEAIINL
jgi:2-iminobutanoate/2-iminopropanoate deaminase